jgi:hypothetical protein
MHNHILTDDPRIFPMPRKNYYKPRFETPQFFRFESISATDDSGFQGDPTRERCFDLKAVDHNEAQMPFEGKVFSRPTKYGIISRENALLSH